MYWCRMHQISARNVYEYIEAVQAIFLGLFGLRFFISMTRAKMLHAVSYRSAGSLPFYYLVVELRRWVSETRPTRSGRIGGD